MVGRQIDILQTWVRFPVPPFHVIPSHAVYGWEGVTEHIFYLTKAEALLRRGSAYGEVQKMRKTYHSSMLSTTYDILKIMGENIDSLKPWIDRLTCLL